MEYSYPLLQKVFDHYAGRNVDLSNTRLFSCMHLLAPQAEMYRKFIQFGFRPEHITVLGKIYSSNGEVIDELRRLGINVVQPDFNGGSFDTEHAENCAAIADRIGNNTTNIVLDDGGYLIHAARSKQVAFAVEQTSSGFRKLEHESLEFPVFNVARSKTKLTQESPLIARQIFERVTDYAASKKLENPSIVIVGLGPIGEASLQIFNSHGSIVRGLDIEMSKADLISYLASQKPDIVIGATGSALLSPGDLDRLENDHTYHFISVSSSDREFPVSKYRAAEGVHEDVAYKNFVFVNNGFPITFKGLENELTPVEIEKTIALLMGSVFQGVTQAIDTPGFIDVPEELQELINS